MDRQTETLDKLSSPGEETDDADTSAESESESCVILPAGPSTKKVKVATNNYGTHACRLVTQARLSLGSRRLLHSMNIATYSSV